MKKTYINPEMEIVDIHTPMLLAGSDLNINSAIEDAVDAGDVLAPGMEVGPSIPGAPSFIFE